jgi:ActR/RegA family two-component response regulator
LFNHCPLIFSGRQRHPNLKILFISGYMDDALAKEGVFDASVEFLGKPYTPGLTPIRFVVMILS